MSAAFGFALVAGPKGSLVLFLLLSLLALREFITLTPTLREDHGTLFWSFFVIAPIQYLLIAIGWYGLYSIFIPVYAFLFVPIRSALMGETERFLERIAKIQWGLMVAVYCVSYAPALLMIELQHYRGENAKLLLFLIVVVQLSDVFQYFVGQGPGPPQDRAGRVAQQDLGRFPRRRGDGHPAGRRALLADAVHPRRRRVMAFVCCLLGFAGGLTMSAIKRDRGVKDFGNLIEGHGGILDRIDSLCFSAPVLFHLTRFFFSAPDLRELAAAPSAAVVRRRPARSV